MMWSRRQLNHSLWILSPIYNNHLYDSFQLSFCLRVKFKMSLCGVDGSRTHYLMLAKHMLQPDELQPHISGDRSIRHSYTFMYLWFSNPRPFPKASHLHCCILGLQRNPLFTTKVIYQVGQGSSFVRKARLKLATTTSQMQYSIY